MSIGAAFGHLSGKLSRDGISDDVDPRVYTVVDGYDGTRFNDIIYLYVNQWVFGSLAISR